MKKLDKKGSVMKKKKLGGKQARYTPEQARAIARTHRGERSPIQLPLLEQDYEFKNVNPSTYKGIYALHKYWSKKPHNTVASFIERYSQKGDIVLDPFSGYGITGIEALRLGRRCALVDLNPVANFISTAVLTQLDLSGVEQEFKELRKRLKPFLDSFYKTQCPYNGEYEAVATHCIHQDDKLMKIWFECPKHRLYRKEKSPSEEDIKTYQQFTYSDIPFWYPKSLNLFDNSRINSKSNMSAEDFFTPRNLYAVSVLYHEIEKINKSDIKDFFKFVFSASLPQMSNMVFVVKNRGKVCGKFRQQELREEVGSWVIGFWLPKEHFEINVWKCFEKRYKKILKGKKQSLSMLNTTAFANTFSNLSKECSNVFIKTDTATNLYFIPDESVDYIFSDPPHGDRIPYFELSALWAAWLGLDLDFKNEIVISDAKKRNKDIIEYREQLYKAFSEMHRVLKTGKFLSVAFNNLGDEEWLSFLDIILSSGFEIVNVSPMHYSAGSVIQDSRKGGLGSDFIFTCVKTLVPSKTFTYNLTLEDLEKINNEVIEAFYRLKESNKSGELKIYYVLNEIIPKLVKEGRVFRISELVKKAKELIQKERKD